MSIRRLTAKQREQQREALVTIAECALRLRTRLGESYLDEEEVDREEMDLVEALRSYGLEMKT